MEFGDRYNFAPGLNLFGQITFEGIRDAVMFGEAQSFNVYGSYEASFEWTKGQFYDSAQGRAVDTKPARGGQGTGGGGGGY